eukprot:COSAG02_NODE_29440_length_569_cov_0.851064_1_plen_35_part_10
MSVSQNGLVTSFTTDDSVAMLAGVPINSRIVRLYR